ncbi:MAG: class I SAM-dependent methyltransferase [Betaproteobacteria bacterium]|nr:class I SAM-dependent methyltransferase [Betaproteobacteria bacterium]MCL2886665.1 class I SAM-dependent methyltransferase [Betaproteobacteria bacterium]
MSTPLRQLALQGAAVILVLSLAWPYFGWRAEAMPWLETSLVIGAVALAFATLMRQPWWWRLIHAAFMPLAWATAQLAIDPGWFLLAFILLLLVYRGALSGQIPLYLSNRQTLAALDQLIAREDAGRILDLGAGLGSVLIPLADAWPERQFTGAENAPASWLLSRLLGIGRPNLDLRWGDLWQTPLAGQDLVYAFLSPAPMEQLWQKARAEMRPGSLFVSNDFPVPGVAPSERIEVPDAPPLYCYRI